MNDGWGRKINLISGSIVLALVGVIALIFTVRKLIEPAPEPTVTYVAYFEDSGGLQEGDAVRIAGRRAGHVTAVEVVMRDGKALTRIEFAIAPGSGSQWLNGAAVPADSTISVKVPSFMGRPQLLISMGNENAEPIEEGGEWTSTRSANSQDQLSQWNEDIVRTQDQIADFLTFFDDKEGFDNLKKQLSDVAAALKQADENIANIVDGASTVAPALDDMTARMDETRKNLAGQGDRASEGLNELDGNMTTLGENITRIDEKLSDVIVEVDRLKGPSSDLASMSEQAKLDQLGLDLRKFAARLRSSMERAKSDPAQFGDMPNWRRSRPYFSGGEPSNGTSIDDKPPDAPGEHSGVPAGLKDLKRMK